jgi:hypothetical protein
VVFRMKGKTCRKDKEEDKFRRMLYVNPARSYESGKGTDMIQLFAKMEPGSYTLEVLSVPHCKSN